jgi:hypothetical protein
MRPRQIYPNTFVCSSPTIHTHTNNELNVHLSQWAVDQPHYIGVPFLLTATVLFHGEGGETGGLADGNNDIPTVKIKIIVDYRILRSAIKRSIATL